MESCGVIAIKGRKPLPSAIRLLTGNRSKRPLNHHEPKAELGIPDCPELDADAQDVWDRVTPHLNNMGILSHADREGLICYCNAVSVYRKAKAIVDKEGLLVVTEKGGVAKHPAVVIMNEQAVLINKFGAALCLDPPSRARFKLPGRETEADPLAKYTA